jgi:transcription elongation factor Elf1
MTTDKLEIVVMCNKCGQYNAVTTKNLSKAVLVCKACGNNVNIRNKHGWNLKVGSRRNDETLGEAVARNNFEQNCINNKIKPLESLDYYIKE